LQSLANAIINCLIKQATSQPVSQPASQPAVLSFLCQMPEDLHAFTTIMTISLFVYVKKRLGNAAQRLS
jgi:hypothetical protein